MQGSYSDENFTYIKLGVKQCDGAKISCANQTEMALKSSVRIYLPESSVSYDTHDTDKAIEWNLHNYYVMQLEPGKTRKQDIFLLKSEVDSKANGHWSS